MRKSLLFSVTCLTAGCLLLLSGCAETSLLKWKQQKHPRADARNPVVKVLCLWEPAQGNDPDGLPTRGFAGQILFFTGQTPTPAEVNGDVRVYLFDDQGPREQQTKPIHQFDFLGDAWKVHLQETTLGPAYHVFVPYVRKGYHQANCALRVRLKPVDGPVIFSEMASVTLPGKTEESTEKSSEKKLSEKSSGQVIVQASATVESENADSKAPRIRQARQPVGSGAVQSAGHPSIDHLVEQALAQRGANRAKTRRLPPIADSNQQENPQTSDPGRSDHADDDVRSEPTTPRSSSAPRRKFQSYTIRVPR